MVDQLCFHCGEPGHRTSSCLIRTTHEQTAEGKEAFKRYIKRKRELAKQHHNAASSSPQEGGIDGDEYVMKDERHFHKVIQWMKEVATCGLDDNIYIIEARDPFALLKAKEEENHNTSNNNNNTIITQQQQKQNELHRAKRKHIDKGHRQEFNRIIDNIRCLLTNTLGVTPEDILESTWQEELTQAVVLGRPANFSSTDVENEEGGGGRCLKVYTVGKLHARCRQLHHLAFNDDEFAGRVRSLLLPIPIQSSLNDTTCYDNGAVNVISLGGGPGYDHVAMCLVAKFLHDIQPQRSMMRKRSIRTQVFDLFDKDWEPIMMRLNDCMRQSLEDGNNNHEIEGNTHRNSGVTMHHADLRLGIDDTSNADLAQALESVNIICIQFCLHENASFLVEDCANRDDNEDPKQQRLGGVMKDIFHHAPKGTTMIVTDSSNTLFPPLKYTANDYGWVYLGDEEMRKDGRKLAFLGPKSYVMLYRIELKFG